MSGITKNGIRYPDNSTKAKNLGHELKQMAEDLDNYIDNLDVTVTGAHLNRDEDGTPYYDPGNLTYKLRRDRDGIPYYTL